MSLTGARPIAGASLLSAAASLPLHLLPVLVLSLTVSGRLDASQAGWLGSAYMVGQLSIVLLLPTLQVRFVRWAAACTAVLVILTAAKVSDSPQPAALLGAWLTIGMMGGVLQYLGTTTAALSARRRMAFGVRMAMSSALGAIVILWLQFFRPRLDYAAVSAQFAIFFAVTAGLGLLLYRSPHAMEPPDTPAMRPEPADGQTRPILAGMVVIFLLFVGQHGLWAFAVQGARDHGLALAQILIAVAACKFSGAAVVLASAWRSRSQTGVAAMLGAGVAVAAGGACLALTGAISVYWVGLFLWEVGFNLLSAQFQAALAQQNPRRAGMWMTAAIFLGAAVGPAVAGAAIGWGLTHVFVAFAAATAVAPFVWAATRAKRGAAPAIHLAS